MIIPNVEAREFLDAWAGRVAAGAGDSLLRIYGGTAPAAAEDSRAGNTLLATLTLSATSFQSAVDFGAFAQITANAITAGTGVASGTATFADLVDGDGTVRGQATVGATGSGAEVELDNVNISVGTSASLTSLLVRMNEAASS